MDVPSDLRPYLRVFAALMVLTAVTVCVAFVDLGRWNDVAMLLIAVTKAGLVAWIFMHLRGSSRLSWVFAAAGVFWLAIFFAFTFADYGARSWLPFYG